MSRLVVPPRSIEQKNRESLALKLLPLNANDASHSYRDPPQLSFWRAIIRKMSGTPGWGGLPNALGRRFETVDQKISDRFMSNSGRAGIEELTFDA